MTTTFYPLLAHSGRHSLVRLLAKQTSSHQALWYDMGNIINYTNINAYSYTRTTMMMTEGNKRGFFSLCFPSLINIVMSIYQLISPQYDFIKSRSIEIKVFVRLQRFMLIRSGIDESMWWAVIYFIRLHHQFDLENTNVNDNLIFIVIMLMGDINFYGPGSSGDRAMHLISG